MGGGMIPDLDRERRLSLVLGLAAAALSVATFAMMVAIVVKVLR